MRKIRLELDGLKVESFRTTDDARAARGTVQGHDSPSTTYPIDPYSFSGNPDGCLCMHPGPGGSGASICAPC